MFRKIHMTFYIVMIHLLSYPTFTAAQSSQMAETFDLQECADLQERTDIQEFANVQKIGRTELQRCGVADLKAYGIFTVGESALYRRNCEQTWSFPPDETLYMEFRYYREIPAKAFRESANRILQRNIDLKASEKALLKEFHKAYRSVNDGDVYVISFNRNTGLKLDLNGQPLATLDDIYLARNYFSIWLGRSPFDENVKRQLLGQK
ncbi:hypothetical protein BTA51_02775 [Hahella sp. CCB-MM4]|uniref:chalcone isomerase family protein n=1 Tax=Hahella sp. (strain CCB-MM4) TaxID=1926491 RepID=UPI000B9A3588|nr:chalcone isomerase family protein [Hahella sp. CCB-MM4]OZG75325.1 hypothetical protein BTA51_02775 [Hahella sp. CCB-MM4]